MSLLNRKPKPEYPTGTYVMSRLDGDIFRVTNHELPDHLSSAGYFGVEIVHSETLAGDDGEFLSALVEALSGRVYATGASAHVNTVLDDLTVISPEEVEAAQAA